MLFEINCPECGEFAKAALSRAGLCNNNAWVQETLIATINLNQANINIREIKIIVNIYRNHLFVGI